MAPSGSGSLRAPPGSARSLPGLPGLGGSPAGAAGGARRRRPRFDPFPTLLLLPALTLLALTLFWPILRAIDLSRFDVALLGLGRRQVDVGLGNFAQLLGDGTFWNALRVTALYSVGTVAPAYLLGLATALLLQQRFPGRGLARLLAIIPWAVPAIVAVLIWTWLLDPRYGIVNHCLRLLGLIAGNLAWLSDPALAPVAVILVTVWQFYPIATVMLLGGLQTIPDEHYEAASIDGAGALDRFRWITLPGLRPVTVVLLLLLTLNAFRTVTIVYVMTGGGPAGATETLSVLTYQTAFKFFKVGYASAIGVVLLLLCLALTLIYLWAVRERETVR